MNSTAPGPAAPPPPAPPASPPGSLVRRALAFAVRFLPTGAVILSILTFAGYAMGLVRDRMFARTFGAGPELDAYNAAFILPELALDVLVASGLVAPFVPLFTGLRAEAAETARAFGRSILTLAVGVMGLTSLVLIVFAPQTVDLIAPGFDAAERDLYIELFRLMCVTPGHLRGLDRARRDPRGRAALPLLRARAALLQRRHRRGHAPARRPDRHLRARPSGRSWGRCSTSRSGWSGITRTTFRPVPTLHLRVRGVRDFLVLMAPKMLSHPVEPLTFLYFTSLASPLRRRAA